MQEPDAVAALGMEYVCIPVGHSRGDNATLAKIRAVIQSCAGKRKLFYHCASGNRSAAALIPYLILDEGMEEQDAVDAAMRLGLRSAELMEWAVEYARKTRG